MSDFVVKRYRPLINEHECRFIECFCKECKLNKNSKCNVEDVCDIFISVDENGLCATRENK